MKPPRRFRPAPIPSLVFAVLLPLFLYLGYWQLQRAEEKRLLQVEYDTRANGPAVQVERRLQRAEELRFYRVVAKGHYETDYQILIDNRVHQGRVGYHVITPLRLENSEVRLLVNRGWIALGEDRDHLPVFETPAGLQQVTGVATVPAEKYFTLAQPEPGWQRVWQNMDLARYGAVVPFPVQPVVLLLDPASGAGGFTRDWSRLDAGISVHQGYAFQWFMLAAALASIYLFMSLRRRGTDTPEQEQP
ncbi:surfeit locus 1 [Sulfuricaulis limicola]|uniref:SURF1-like protein n=1 Tax=Sulfuricaulis limicola TaxID=1620215 RepID=A0A1B4XD53_9GAMM|nr:SURF1 family protein [Sulfuricaulis limicola]BAV32731.1 surfeit locus 1 [Sulfuricaulis limicola]